MQNFLKILENGCRYSINVSNKLFGETSLVHDLGCFLPCHQFSASGSKHQFATDDFPFINEAINLLNSLLSDKAEEAEEKKPDENDDDGDSVMKAGEAQDKSAAAEKDKIEESADKQLDTPES